MTFEHARQTITEYVCNQVPPGGFIQAVLANDLHATFARADKESLTNLQEILQFIHYHVPTTVYGSWAALEKHLGPKGKPEQMCSV